MKNNIRLQIEKVREDFIVASRARLDMVIARIGESQLDAGALQSIREVYHRLAGSAGSFGLEHVSELAKQAELCCQNRIDRGELLQNEDLEKLRPLNADLQSELSS